MKVILMIALVAGLASGQAWAEPGSKKTMSSFTELEALLKLGGTASATLDGFLDRLAKDYPGTFDNFSLVYASRSLQNASPQFPRAILFGQGFDFMKGTYAPLILTFGTDPGKGDFNSLEVMSLDSGREIQLAEVRFRGAGATPQIERNPPRCTACHGGHNMPIWDSYPIWPGVYGSEEDVMDTRSDELANFRSFIQPKLGKEGRLRHIHAKVVQASTPQGGSSLSFGDASFNQGLQMNLDQLANRAILTRVRAAPDFSFLRYAFLGATGGCLNHGLGDWFSPGQLSALGLDFQEVLGVTADDIAANNAFKAKMFFNLHGKPVPADGGHLRSIDADQMAGPVRFVSLLSGDNMRSWSKTFQPRALSFATRGLETLFFRFYEDQRADPIVSAAVKTSGAIEPEVDCAPLAAANRAALTDEAASRIGAGMPALSADLRGDGFSSRPVLLRCASCHTEPLRGPDGRPKAASGAGEPPFFPFDRPMELGRLLAAGDGALLARMIEAVNAPADDPKRMPKSPRPPLSAAERDAVTDFLKAVVVSSGPK